MRKLSIHQTIYAKTRYIIHSRWYNQITSSIVTKITLVSTMPCTLKTTNRLYLSSHRCTEIRSTGTTRVFNSRIEQDMYSCFIPNAQYTSSSCRMRNVGQRKRNRLHSGKVWITSKEISENVQSTNLSRSKIHHYLIQIPVECTVFFFRDRPACRQHL